VESLLTIDEAAQRTGLTAYTLRYYERIGLIAPVARAAGGQRRYAASDMVWIEFLLRLRTTHMPIGKMQAFAKLRGTGDATVADRRRMLEQHLTDVLAQIKAMRQSAAALQEKIAHYRSLEQSLASDSTSDQKEHHHVNRSKPPKTGRGNTGRNHGRNRGGSR
jgi:DNA-binding transcriptional MerR regulator